MYDMDSILTSCEKRKRKTKLYPSSSLQSYLFLLVSVFIFLFNYVMAVDTAWFLANAQFVFYVKAYHKEA